MNIIHFSDTHLGLGLENSTRESDFYNNFEFVIDEILKIKPDFVIHTGDLFNTAKPSNKAISIVVKNFIKLSNQGIKTIIIAGNHDTPRLSTTTHSFEIFREIKDIYSFYEPKTSIIEFEEINFVCLPHIHDEELFQEELKSAKKYIKTDKKNVYLSHFGLQVSEYEEYTDEISGVNIKKDDLENLKKYDYVALGHYHKNFCMGNICYSGSLEHTSFNQKDYKLGFNEIFFNKNDIKIKKNIVKTRNMKDLGIIDCSGILKTEELITKLESITKDIDINGAIIKIVFNNMENSLILEFNQELIRRFFSQALHFEYKKIKKITNNKKQQLKNTSGDLILNNFDNFYKNYTIDNENIKKDNIGKELKELLKN